MLLSLWSVYRQITVENSFLRRLKCRVCYEMQNRGPTIWKKPQYSSKGTVSVFWKPTANRQNCRVFLTLRFCITINNAWSINELTPTRCNAFSFEPNTSLCHIWVTYVNWQSVKCIWNYSHLAFRSCTIASIECCGICLHHQAHLYFNNLQHCHLIRWHSFATGHFYFYRMQPTSTKKTPRTVNVGQIQFILTISSARRAF
jgi:hypothetical protein